jgi:hypothetical protein
VTGKADEFFTKDGGPYTMAEYIEVIRQQPGESQQDAWDRVHRVALDQIGEYSISTVALLVDIGFTSVQRFETMVFLDGHGCVDTFTQRYATIEQAIHGHDQTTAFIRDMP